MTKPKGILLLVSWSALVLVAAGKLEVEADEERVKRSDDFPASQGELAKLAQTVSLQGAQITLLKNQVTQLQSSLRKSGCFIYCRENKIPIHKRFKITLFIRTKHNLRIFGIIRFIKLQNDTFF